MRALKALIFVIFFGSVPVHAVPFDGGTWYPTYRHDHFPDNTPLEYKQPVLDMCTANGWTIDGVGNETWTCRNETNPNAAYWHTILSGVCVYDAGGFVVLMTVSNDSYDHTNCPTQPPSQCGEAGDFAYHGTGDASTYCADSCELTMTTSQGITSDSNGTLWGTWEYTGETCDDTYNGNYNTDYPADNCAEFQGQTVCLDETQLNCGTVNGEQVCLDSIPGGQCTFLAEGSMICGEAEGTPPAPDTGVVGQEALEDFQLTHIDNSQETTYNYYNSSTVQGSTTSNENNDQGDSDIAQYCRDNPNASICDSTGTPQNTDVDVTVNVDEQAIGDATGQAVADALGCEGDSCNNLDLGTESTFGDTTGEVDAAKQRFTDAVGQLGEDFSDVIDVTLATGATMQPLTITLPTGDVNVDMSLLVTIFQALGLILILVALWNSIGIVIP